MDDGTMLSVECMFGGKNLAWFLEHYAPLYARLVAEHGREKVLKVYAYFFAFVSRMKWGQWMVLEKVCPSIGDRQLFYWVMELIYQSDLISQMQWKWEPSDELRLVVVAPTPEQVRRWAPFLGADHYLYIDWYRRLLHDPGCNSDIKPEWLLLDADGKWGSGAEGKWVSAAEGKWVSAAEGKWVSGADGHSQDDGGEADALPDD